MQLAEHLKQRESTRAAQRQVFDEYLPTYLVPLISDSQKLENSLDEASVVAETVSRRVREVDVIRKKAIGALQHATDAIQLKECVEGVESALTKAQYEIAVEHMSVYLRFDRRITDAETRATMSLHEEKLLHALREQLSRAIDANSISEMTRLTKLFAPLGLHDEGVAHYASYLEKQINTDLEAILSKAEESSKSATERGTGEKASYAAAISQLVQRAHQRLKRAKPVLEQAFGASGLLHALLILQPILSSHICTLIDDLLRDWNLFKSQTDSIARTQAARKLLNDDSSILSLASYAPSSSSSSSSSLPQWNPLDFSPILDQLVIICQTIEVHSRFAAAVIAQAKSSLQKIEATTMQKINAQQSLPSMVKQASETQLNKKTISVSSSNSIASEPSESQPQKSSEEEELQKTRAKIEAHSAKLGNAVQLGPLNERLVELLGYYLKFEQHYLNRSIETVIDHDTSASHSNEVRQSSALVDDVFFLLKEASNRARATYNANTLCAVTNFISLELNEALYDLLEENSSREALQAARSSALTSGPIYFSGSNASASALNVLIAINQLEQTSTYTQLLKNDIEEPSKKIFVACPHDIEKIFTCCDELQRTETKYRQLITAQLEQIVEAIKPRFQPLFDIILAVSYKLSPSEYAANQINDPFADQLIQGVKDILSPIENVLSQTNSATLGALITRVFVRQLERTIIKKPFTQLGAQQLDTDVQKVSDFFAAHSPKGFARECFQRLSQIAFLLNFDSLEDAQEEWNTRISNRVETDKPAWTLSSTDLKRVLSLRIDFPKEKVASLAVRDSGLK